MSDPERLIQAWLDEELTEPERVELAELLRSNPGQLNEFVDALLFEQQIRASVVAREQHAAFQPANAHGDDDGFRLANGSSQRRARAASRHDRRVFWSLAVLIAALTVAAATGWGGNLRRLAQSYLAPLTHPATRSMPGNSQPANPAQGDQAPPSNEPATERPANGLPASRMDDHAAARNHGPANARAPQEHAPHHLAPNKPPPGIATATASPTTTGNSTAGNSTTGKSTASDATTSNASASNSEVRAPAGGVLPAGPQPASASVPTGGQRSRFCAVVWVSEAKGDRDGPPADGNVLTPGTRLGAGHVRLVSGTAELQFDNGVRAICTGPIDIELRGPLHAWLHHGEVVLRVPPSGIGYTLETKDAVIVDLGTEFGVRVEPAQLRIRQGTELQVYEGEVLANVKSATEGGASCPRRVFGGQALRIGHDAGGTVQELPFRPERFVHEMPDPRDHPEAAVNGLPKKSPYNKPRHDSIRVMPAPPNVAIDGSLAEWDLSGRFASECPAPWSEFYNVQGALMYDSGQLYVGAMVADPFPLRSTVSPKPDRELYGGGGSVVLRLSADRQLNWPVEARIRAISPKREFLESDRNPRLASLVMWYFAAESLPCLDLRYGMDFHGRKLNPPGFRGAWKKRPDGLGYTMEYAIPWSLLNVADDPPRAGDTLACTFLVHWSDTAGQNWRGQLIEIVNSKARGWNFENAATWGRAIYMPRAGH